jgi:hypothetical protein
MDVRENWFIQPGFIDVSTVNNLVGKDMRGGHNIYV